MNTVFDEKRCVDLNQARLEHLASLALPLENTTVLEVGCGVGLLTSFFEERGCRTLSTDARPENIAEFQRRQPHRQAALRDLSCAGSHDDLGKFAVVFCYGTLYHLKDPALALKDLAGICTHLFLLETCVFPQDNGQVNPVPENQEERDQSFEGAGCRPARDWVWAELKKYFPYIYATATQPRHPHFPLSWPADASQRLTRAVFVASRKPLSNPNLVDGLPDRQYPCPSPAPQSTFSDPPLAVIERDPARNFEMLIANLARAHRRLYFRDQTPASLAALITLAEEFQPTRIVELGTCLGLSLRAWLAARTPACVTAVDLSFAALRHSLTMAPVDLSRVTLLEQDILRTDFSGLWDPGDWVLLYVDAHDQPQAPIMDHILQKALPVLPPGSLVVVDDLWHSPTPLNPDNVAAFFRSRVLPEIDPLQCFPGHYASYWQGGAFLGFAETIPLLTWVNRQALHLRLYPGAKLASFSWPPEKVPGEAQGIPEHFKPRTGSYFFHPVKTFALAGADRLNLDRGTFEALSRHVQGAELFSQGKIQEALGHFAAAGRLCPDLAGAFYAQAVCWARLGRLDEADRCLGQELAGPFPHSRTRKLRQDIHAWLKAEENTDKNIAVIPEAPALTIFAIPKAFQGHTGVIQKNALQSWTRLTPRPAIILFGNDPGTAAIAQELNLRHVPDIALSAQGAPRVRDLFHRAEALAPTGTLAYVNADIILGQDFLDAAAQVRKNFSRFLMVGQRWDLDITEPLNFDDPDWPEALRRRVNQSGVLHVVSALDYFVFSRGLWPEIPDFALGRTAWDNWLVSQPLAAGIPVVDATARVQAVHQNHRYQHTRGGRDAVWRGEEARCNQELAWESPLLCYSSHATWEVTQQGLVPRPRQGRALPLAWEGVTLLSRGEFQEALSRFEETLRLLPAGIPGLHYLRALALEGLGRRPEAIHALREELLPHPTHHPAKRLLASLEQSPDRCRAVQPAAATSADRPLISVVTPTHNRARFVAEALRSALTQEFRDLEMVVVDDGSTDNTPEVLAQILDPRLRYIRKPKTNAPDTRNHGIKAARGDYILWLDSDDLLLPGWLARLGSLLAAGTEADVYYGNLEVVDDQKKRLKVIRYEDFAGKNSLLLARLVHGNPLPLPGSLMRKTLLEEVGFFEVEFTRAHDYEFWTRLAPMARFRHVPFLAVQWRWHHGNMSSGSVKRDLSFEARVLKRLLTRHPLTDLFPDLPWEDWTRAQGQAARQLQEIFSRYGDQQAAQEWLRETQELLAPRARMEQHAAL